MKITQITYTGFCGLGSVVFSLITADRDKQYDWKIGFLGEKELDNSYPSRCQTHGVEFAVFKSTPGHPYYAWIKLAKWLKKTKPDMVICHSINTILACRWYTLWHKAKLVAVEHAPNQLKTRNERIASWLSMLLADRVVLLTKEYEQELRQLHRGWFRPQKVQVIPNGIDTDVFYPQQSPTSNSDGTILRLGMAARFADSKRQDLLITVLEQLAKIKPELSWELHFAGDGSEFEKVKSLAENSSVTSQIRFEGLLSEDDIAPWLRKLDIYAHATEGETLSTSLLQAMATGLPIVSSDIPGVVNLLGDSGQYGACAENNATAFAQVIIELAEQKKQSAELGKRARARITEAFSNQAMLHHYLNTIDSGAK